MRLPTYRPPGAGAVADPAASNLEPMPLRVAGAQLNLVVGDIDGNERRIAEAMDWAEDEGADVLVLPELAIGGYPPEVLLLRDLYFEAVIDPVSRVARL